MLIDLNLIFCVDDSEHIAQGLMQAVFKAHYKAALTNQCASSVACINAFASSGNLSNGISSALMTVGTLHAPIAEARKIYETATQKDVRGAMLRGDIVPGFGNSFFRVGIDPSWEGVARYIEANFPKMHGRIYDLTKWVQDSGKILYPNAALYSAAAASECRVKHGAEIALFALARIPAWTELCIP